MLSSTSTCMSLPDGWVGLSQSVRSIGRPTSNTAGARLGRVIKMRELSRFEVLSIIRLITGQRVNLYVKVSGVDNVDEQWEA